MTDPKDINVVVERVSVLPIPYVPSDKVVCAVCGEDCWITVGSDNQDFLARGARAVCVRCARLESDPEEWEVSEETAIRSSWVAALLALAPKERPDA